MNFHTRALTFAAASILLTTPIAIAQSANGTTLAGGDNGKAAKMSETKKSGSMMKSDGMKSGGMKKGSVSSDKMGGTSAPMTPKQ